jgi:hypothetical protein
VEILPNGDAVLSWGQDDGDERHQGLREIGRISGAVAPGTLLTPIVAMENRGSTRRIGQVDYFLVTSGRDSDR